MPGHIRRPNPKPAVNVGSFPSRKRSGRKRSGSGNIYDERLAGQPQRRTWLIKLRLTSESWAIALWTAVIGISKPEWTRDSLDICVNPATFGDKHPTVYVIAGVAVRHTKGKNRPPPESFFHDCFVVWQQMQILEFWLPIRSNNTIEFLLSLLHNAWVV